MTDRPVVGDAADMRRASRRRQATLVTATILAVTAVFYHEVIFLGRSFIPVLPGAGVTSLGPYGFDSTVREDVYRPDRGASAWASEPWARKVADEYAAGRFPTWNEHQGFGAPLLGNAQSGAMDVLRLPVFLNGSPLSWDIYYILRAVGGVIVAYLFARALGMRVPAAVFLAIGYVFSGHFLLFGNAHWVEIYLLLPGILLGTELIGAGRLRIGFAVTAVSIALALLAGMPEAALLVLLAAAAYGVYRLAAVALSERAWLPALRCAVVLAAAWLVGMAIAAPMLLTLAEFVPVSFSTHPPDRGLGLATAPIGDLVYLGLPYLNGEPVKPLTGAGVLNVHNYLGATVLVLAAYALFSARSRHFPGLAMFALLAVLLLLAKTYGAPVVNELGRLPGLNVTWFPRWSAPITGFGLILLAAVGVHRLTAEPARPLAAAAALAAFVAFALAGVHNNQASLEEASRAHLLGTLGLAALFAAATCGVLLVRRWVAGNTAAIACCGLVVAELLAYAPRGIYQDRYDPLTEAPYVTFLTEQQAAGPFRIYATNGLLFPNLSTPFGIDDIRSLDALYIDRYLSFIKNFISPEVTDRYTGAPYASSEKETAVRDNPWFDVANVRYVVTNPGEGSALTTGGLMQAIIDSNGGATPSVHIDTFTIEGDARSVLFEHPPMTLRYPLRVTADRQVLRFALALSPAVWDPAAGDGVGFDIAVEMDGRVATVFHREIDPKGDQADRRWIADSVDLSPYLGTDVVLVLTTTPLARSDSDWAGWGDLRLTPATGDATAQYRLVYDREVQIFENTQALPRAFLVGAARVVGDERGAIEAMHSGGVDPRREAVIEDAPVESVAALRPGPATATIRSYDATSAVVETDAESPSLLILVDSFYPGWEASIDGNDVEIYATDLAFRGVFVPAGRHTVVFSYQPRSFRLGLAMMSFGLTAVACYTLAPAVRRAVTARRRQGTKAGDRAAG